MKLLIVGDLHLRDRRGYADSVSDGRLSEQQTILNTILDAGKSCDRIILLGDNFNSKNNTSLTISLFTNFIEGFSPKPVYILSGNHSKSANGKSALDFLKEIKGKHWTVVTDKIEVIDELVLCPYFYKNELGCETNEEAAEKVMGMLPDGKFMFAHQAISGAKVRGTITDMFNEIVLPAEKLAEKYEKTFFGHIHNAQTLLNGKIIGSGSVFCDEAGETSKSIWTLDTEANNVIETVLPGRGIHSLVDPTIDDLLKIEKSNIIRAVLTKKVEPAEMEELKEQLRKFDAYVLLEQYPSERRKLVYNEKANILESSTEELLEIYSKQNKVNLTSLANGWNIIK